MKKASPYSGASRRQSDESLRYLAGGSIPWVILPSLSLFILLPSLLERKMSFYVSLTLSTVMMVGLYLRELSEILGAREAAGDAAGFDRLRAEREVLDVETDRRVAATDRARAQAVLASFFDDVPDPSRLVAVEASTPPVPVPPVAGLLEIAETARGELVALRYEIEAAGLAGRAAGRRLVPEPTLLAGTKSSTFGGEIGSVVALQIEIPLFDRAHPERTLAARRGDEARVRLDAMRRVLQGQIASLRAAVVDRREAAERYRVDAVHTADQIERIARVSYDAGERGILELLDAHRLGAAARTRQATLDAAVRQAEIELAFVSGWEMTP